MVLVLGTFAPLVAGSLPVDFRDNNGFTHALAMSGGHYPECNFVTEKMLMHLAAVDADLLAARVESVDNIADESTRDTFDLVDALQATYVSPQIPGFMVCGIVCLAFSLTCIVLVLGLFVT